MKTLTEPDEGYLGLTSTKKSLPREAYLSTDCYQRELDLIWCRHWLYVAHDSELPAVGDYRLLTVGDQEVILLRDEAGELQAFHNVCRHRGSVLLTDEAGRLPSGRLTCPYHAWSYSLQGDLQRVSSRHCPVDFDMTALSLHSVALTNWRGFVFISLAEEPPTFDAALDYPDALMRWPLEQLQVGYQMAKTVACNWKVFWENFNECLHCPGVHPELSALVPLYRKSLMEPADAPYWRSETAADPDYQAGLREGARSWTKDGELCAAQLPGLEEEDVQRGHTYVTALPTCFLVGHADYVRIVWLRPIGPTFTEISAQWLFHPDALADPAFDASGVAAFAEGVLSQDARAAELNQRGLNSRAFRQGVLMPEEYDVHNFQRWVREQLV